MHSGREYAALLIIMLGIAEFVWRSSTSLPPADLDLRGFSMTFDEEFTTLSVSPHGPGTRWIAHTPWHGDFGDARFDDPGPAGPFTTSPAGLSITAWQDSQGKWHSGLLCSRSGPHGFGQHYGYFEIMTKLPGGNGVWPAFWLIGDGKTMPAPEIDIFELYGRFRNSYRITEHLWLHNRDSLHLTRQITVPRDTLFDTYHRFGTLIEPNETSFYLDGVQVWVTMTPPAFGQKLYIMLDLALGSGWPITGLTSPQIMQVRYVRAYEKMKPVFASVP